MAEPDASQEKQMSDVQGVSEKAFSSEKREDVWALIIATGILVLSVAFPARIHHFFSSMLYLF